MRPMFLQEVEAHQIAGSRGETMRQMQATRIASMPTAIMASPTALLTRRVIPPSFEPCQCRSQRDCEHSELTKR